MLKKIYIKNGIIMIPIIDNMQLNYTIINDKNILDKNVLDTAKKNIVKVRGVSTIINNIFKLLISY